MNHKMYFAGAALLALSANSVARADSFHNEQTPPWARPINIAQASSTLTTYQQWDGFVASANPTPFSVPTAQYPDAPTNAGSVNPNGTAGAFDGASPTDGSFFIPNVENNDIYSFGAVINPEVIVPEYNVTGQKLNVVVQLQYYGADINLNDLNVTYTDADGFQQTKQASELEDYKLLPLYSNYADFGGFGEADTASYEWEFTVPNTSTIELSWGWGVESSAIEYLAVDTQSVAVPEPASIGLIGSASLLLMRRRRRA